MERREQERRLCYRIFLKASPTAQIALRLCAQRGWGIETGIARTEGRIQGGGKRNREEGGNPIWRGWEVLSKLPS